MTLRLTLALAALLASAAANAADYRAEAGSTLGFRATYMDEAFDGRFARFTPEIRFDPANLAASRFDVRIVLASASTNNEERDQMLVGPEFFDATGAAEQPTQPATAPWLGAGTFAGLVLQQLLAGL